MQKIVTGICLEVVKQRSKRMHERIHERTQKNCVEKSQTKL